MVVVLFRDFVFGIFIAREPATLGMLCARASRLADTDTEGWRTSEKAKRHRLGMAVPAGSHVWADVC